MTPAILVVEDQLPLRRVLRSALGGQGYRVWEAGSLSEGLTAFTARSPQAILLDLGLPDGDGIELVTAVRETSDVPIVIISARGDERDQVQALDSGANDYVTKPFREAELLARLRAVLRSAARWAPQDETLTVGELRIHTLERQVFRNETEIALTPTEFNLLQLMAREAGRVMTHRQLLREVWGASHVEDVQYLRVFMKQLRAKLEQDPSKPQLLITAPGVGYRVKASD